MISYSAWVVDSNPTAANLLTWRHDFSISNQISDYEGEDRAKYMASASGSSLVLFDRGGVAFGL